MSPWKPPNAPKGPLARAVNNANKKLFKNV